MKSAGVFSLVDQYLDSGEMVEKLEVRACGVVAEAARDRSHTCKSVQQLQARSLFNATATFKMEGLLTAVKTVKRDAESPLVARESVSRDDVVTKSIIDFANISPNQVIDALKSHPTTDELFAILSALDPFNSTQTIQDLDIRIPGPITAQILQLLVSTTIPDHWGSLNAKGRRPKDAKTRAALLRCLSSVAGIGSLVAQQRSLIATARASAMKAEGSSSDLVIQDVLSVCAALLEPKDFLFRLKSDISSLYDSRIRQQVAWRELVSLVAGGKILSTAAEALAVTKNLEHAPSISWVGDGPRYASWLGGNIAYLNSKLQPDGECDWPSVALLTGRALSLGYSGTPP